MDAKLSYNIKESESLEIILEGDFIAYDNSAEKDKLYSVIDNRKIKKVSFNAKKLGKWDSTFLIILSDVVTKTKNKSIKVSHTSLPEGALRMIDLAFSVDRKPIKSTGRQEPLLERWGQYTLDIIGSFKRGCLFIKDAFISIGRFFKGTAVMRPVDFLFALEDCSYKSLGIVALISFMVGLIVGFVGAVQLKLFGAQIFVASLVAVAMVRVMGALMTGIIIAGRTGSSYAATIGTMQVNEEIDALKPMGIKPIDFLLLPRMIALILMMPLLTVFSDVMGILGGAFVGVLTLDLAPQEYWNYTVDALSVKNFMVGILHGFTFGCVISICGCYFGINCGRDADSVGKATTLAVVYSIIWIVITTAIITLFCNWLGI
jgi:phospholipid/cholesterol/gamma-HCH transport system permease protein